MKWLYFYLLSASFLGAMQQDSKHTITLDKKEHPTHWQIVAKSNNDGLYGYINYLPVVTAERRWLISYLFVEKNQRNKGIASLLLKECFLDLKEKNARIIVWDCSPMELDQNAQALATMYQSIIKKNITAQMPGILTKNTTPWATVKMTYQFT